MKRYYSKLLLFGEHVIVKGSEALAIPYPQHYAQWKTGLTTEEAKTSNEHLNRYLLWLFQHDKSRQWLDIQTFARESSHNLYLASSIPQGYGVGSSGAVVAAIYDRYARKKEEISAKELKARLAFLEGYFHGASSGTDPLVCFMNKGIVIHKNKEISLVELPEYSTGKGGLFLVDTHIKRKTGPLVQAFQKKCEEAKFDKLCQEQLTPLGEACISAYLEQKTEELLENVKALSKLQLTHLQFLIPEQFLEIWQRGLTTNTYSLKICGAGGGGYLLGFTKDFQAVAELLVDYQPQLVHPL